MRFNYRGVEFGGLGEILVENFDPGAATMSTSDFDRPMRDGVLPGRDFIRGRTWGFDLVTNRRNLTEALQTASLLESRWTAEDLRLNPLAKEALSYELDGRWRRVYGRPGSYAGFNGNTLAKQGAGRIVADFRVMDHLYYDEDEQVVRLTIVPASTGGLVAPLVAPLTTMRSGAPRAGLVNNTGNAATPLTAVFKGPITDPWVRAAAGWEIGLSGTLAYDETVTVDPLLATVTRNDGAPVAGMLTRATRLAASRLPVGPSELTFGGSDPTGTATVELRWRNASTSI